MLLHVRCWDRPQGALIPSAPSRPPPRDAELASTCCRTDGNALQHYQQQYFTRLGHRSASASRWRLIQSMSAPVPGGTSSRGSSQPQMLPAGSALHGITRSRCTTFSTRRAWHLTIRRGTLQLSANLRRQSWRETC